MVSPLRPSIRAGTSGRSLPVARMNSGTDRSGISTSGYGLARGTGTPPRRYVAPVSHPAGRRPQGGYSRVHPRVRSSPRPEHRLRAAEQRDRPPGAGVGHDGVPHLRRPPGVDVGRDGVDPALPGRAEMVALQLDRGEAGGPLGQQRAGGQAAAGVGERHDGGRVQVAVGRQQLAADVEVRGQPAAFVGVDDDAEQAGQRAREQGIELVGGEESGRGHARQRSDPRDHPSPVVAVPAVWASDGDHEPRATCAQPWLAFSQRPTTLPSGSLKYAAKPMSPTGVFPATVDPPSPAILSSVASMLSTSTTMTGPPPALISRDSMPPLMKPGSVGPLSPLGPDITIV